MIPPEPRTTASPTLVPATSLSRSTLAATFRIGVSINPAMNVKPSNAATPHTLLRSAVTINSEPIITPNISNGVMIGAALNSAMKLSDMPAIAPAMVGSIDNASNQ
jgi:hypothetical protein